MTPVVWLAGGFVAGVWLSRYWAGGTAAPLIIAGTVLAAYALARSYGLRIVVPTLFPSPSWRASPEAALTCWCPVATSLDSTASG